MVAVDKKAETPPFESAIPVQPQLTIGFITIDKEQTGEVVVCV